MANNKNLLLSDCTITVNDIAVDYIADTLKMDLGLGEQEVKVATAGGGSTTTVYADDAKSKMSHYEFDIYATQYNVELIRTWKNLKNAMVLKVIDNQTGATYTVNNAACTNLIKNELSASGKTSIEFKGDPTV